MWPSMAFNTSVARGVGGQVQLGVERKEFERVVVHRARRRRRLVPCRRSGRASSWPAPCRPAVTDPWQPLRKPLRRARNVEPHAVQHVGRCASASRHPDRGGSARTSPCPRARWSIRASATRLSDRPDEYFTGITPPSSNARRRQRQSGTCRRTRGRLSGRRLRERGRRNRHSRSCSEQTLQVHQRSSATNSSRCPVDR